MAISLLWSGCAVAPSVTVHERLLYHLSLDRAFARICTDVKKRDRFLAILAEWNVCAEDVVLRQEVLRDLREHPALIEQLCALAARFDELRVSHGQTDREAHRLRTGGLDSVAASKNVVQSRALCLKRALLFVRGFEELLAGCDLKSSAMQMLLGACREITRGDDFQRLITYCTKYERLGTGGHIDLKLTWNGDGRIEACSLIDHQYIRVTDPELKKKGFSLFKKSEESYPCARIHPLENGFYGGLTVEALAELAESFACISEQLFERFGRLCHELVFYDVALRYMTVLDEKQIPHCFPTISDGDLIVERLYDLYLIVSADDPAAVVPNDVNMTEGARGLVVYGDNGSGKTAYLRSIGAMQLLAQAGLPIPAVRAQVPLCTQIATQFSEAEKEFCGGNEAGRFEQEVRELATMVETLQNGALVLLNETFQSTAYAEGAEGLYHLLRYFSDRGIRWILVSHLRRLEQMLQEGEATVLHTADGFRIVP